MIPAVPVTVSVVVCAFAGERWSALVAAVASVERQSLPPARIVVVIDHNPALLTRARARFPNLTVVANRHERGLSGARNTGVERAVGDVVAFLDDDAVAAPDWLECLVSPFAEPTVVGVGGAVVPDWEGGRPAWFPPEFDWVVGCSYVGLPDRPGPIRNPIGANMAYRRQLFDTGEGFRAGLGRVGSLPLGCEETEFAIRATRRDPAARLVYAPAARVAHAVPAQRARPGYFVARCFAEGVSKAVVAGLVGSERGLSAERDYARRVLPRGIVAGVQAAAGGDAAGLLRSAAIVAGFAATALGYAAGRLRRLLGRPGRPAARAAAPCPAAEDAPVLPRESVPAAGPG